MSAHNCALGRNLILRCVLSISRIHAPKGKDAIFHVDTDETVRTHARSFCSVHSALTVRGVDNAGPAGLVDQRHLVRSGQDWQADRGRLP